MRRSVVLVVSGLACSAFSLFGWAGQASALNISIDQPIVSLSLAPGETTQGSIEVTNSTSQPVSVSVYLEDWRYLPPWDGNKEFGPPATLPRSAASWVTFYPRQLTIPASAKAKVDFSVRMPKDQPLDGGYYAVLFFESTLGQGPSPKDQGVMVHYAARIGSMFLLEAKGTVRREASLDNVQIRAVPGSSSVTLSATLTNSGNTILICSGSHYFQAPTNIVAGRGELPQQYLWPGAQSAVSAEWVGSLAPGAYHVVLTYACGEALVAVGEGELAIH